MNACCVGREVQRGVGRGGGEVEECTVNLNQYSITDLPHWARYIRDPYSSCSSERKQNLTNIQIIKLNETPYFVTRT